MYYTPSGPLYMSIPSVYRQYIQWRKIDRKPYDIYKGLGSHYKKETSFFDKIEPIKSYFPQEPFTYVDQCYDHMKEPKFVPNYLISCYEHTPLSDYPSVALYIKKTLGFENAETFSISGVGSISPIFALQLVDILKKEAIITCLEHIYDDSNSWVGDGYYYKGDALAIVKVTSEKSNFRILDYGFRSFNSDSCSKSIANETFYFINQLLSRSNSTIENTLVLAQCWSFEYNEVIKQLFPHHYIKGLDMNLSTADPFYALEELVRTGSELKKNIIALCYVNSNGLLGGMILERVWEI